MLYPMFENVTPSLTNFQQHWMRKCIKNFKFIHEFNFDLKTPREFLTISSIVEHNLVQVATNDKNIYCF